MKLIAVTQRVDTFPDRAERRDALDQRWHDFLAACGYAAIIMPNRKDAALGLFAATHCAGLLLTGGNDLLAFGGDAPERDETELALLAHCRDKNIPTLAVCRGMQLVQHAEGGRVERVAGHAGTRHTVTGAEGTFEVNSYHNYAVTACAPGFTPLATATDGTIEHCAHTSQPLDCIMWHPERESTFSPRDIALFQKVFA